MKTAFFITFDRTSDNFKEHSRICDTNDPYKDAFQDIHRDRDLTSYHTDTIV